MDDFESLLSDIHEDLLDKELNLESLFITAIHTINEETNINRKIYNSKKEIIDGILGVKKDSNSSKTFTDSSQDDFCNKEDKEELENDIIIKNEDTSLLTTNQINFDTPPDDDDDNSMTNNQEEYDDVTDEDKESLCHKLYKQIALVCHPDKNKNIVFNKYFIKSKEAYQSQNLLILIYIFYKVSLPYKNIEERDIKIINNEIECKRKDIESKKSHILYKWSDLPDDIKSEYIKNLKNQNTNIF